jgi:hypothetical protein
MMNTIQLFNAWLQCVLTFMGGWHHGEGSEESRARWYLAVPLTPSLTVDWETLQDPRMPWHGEATWDGEASWMGVTVNVPLEPGCLMRQLHSVIPYICQSVG